MKKNKIKLSRSVVKILITGAILGAVVLSLVITNLFIPVKYLSAYIIFGKDLPKEGKTRVTFFNVGYGNCTFAELPDGKSLLIDGGNGSYVNQLNLLRFLNVRGVEHIDYLVCTSVLAEHCGGLAEVIKYKNVGKIFMPYCYAAGMTDGYDNFCKVALSGGSETAVCEYGAGVFSENYSFCFLSPSIHTNPDGEYAKLNSEPTLENIKNASATLWLQLGDVSFLLTGDGTQSAHKKLVESYSLYGGFEIADKIVRIEDCDVLLVSGHGAKVSDCVEIYDLAKPSTAIISTDSSPSVEAISNAQRYARDSFYRTDKNGTITVICEGNKYTVKKEK